jgi:hypothetical protein
MRGVERLQLPGDVSRRLGPQTHFHGYAQGGGTFEIALTAMPSVERVVLISCANERAHQVSIGCSVGIPALTTFVKD